MKKNDSKLFDENLNHNITIYTTYVSGIYIIRNLKNNKIYIGESINIENRWNDHKLALQDNKHYNSNLQSDYNEYGEDAFSFEVLHRYLGKDIIDTKATLIILENKYMRLFNKRGYELYNIQNTLDNILLGNGQYSLSLFNKYTTPPHKAYKIQNDIKMAIVDKLKHAQFALIDDDLISISYFHTLQELLKSKKLNIRDLSAHYNFSALKAIVDSIDSAEVRNSVLHRTLKYKNDNKIINEQIFLIINEDIFVNWAKEHYQSIMSILNPVKDVDYIYISKLYKKLANNYYTVPDTYEKYRKILIDNNIIIYNQNNDLAPTDFALKNDLIYKYDSRSIALNKKGIDYVKQLFE